MPSRKVKKWKEPEYPRGRYLDMPSAKDVEKYEYRREVRNFVEQHMKKAGIEIPMPYRERLREGVRLTWRESTAKAAAVKAAMIHFHVSTERQINRLIEPTIEAAQFDQYYSNYKEYLEREAAAEAQLKKYYSADECKRLIRLLPNGLELFVKLANERAELENLRSLFNVSLDDRNAWAKIKQAIKQSLTPGYSPTRRAPATAVDMLVGTAERRAKKGGDRTTR